MTLVELNKKYYTVPTCWNELSQRQLLQVMETLYLKQYIPEQVILKLLKVLFSFNYWQFFSAKVEQLEEYIYLVSFLFEKEVSLTKNLLPYYEGFYGPDDEINNMVMSEFVFSEDYFMRWNEDRENIALLNDFIAVIYRPAKEGYDFELNPDGDCRIDFNPNVCAWYAKEMIARWPMAVKLAIAYFYSGSRQLLINNNPDVFGGEGESAKYGLISVMRNIAKDGAFGDFEKVEKKNVNLVMIELNIVVDEARKLEKANKV